MENNLVSKQQRNELISNEMQELISYRPHWIIRKGNALFLVVFMLFLASTFLIKYPNVINGSLKLTAINAPRLLLAQTECKIEELLVNNDEEVTQGQPLAILQSTAWDSRDTIVAPEDGKVLFASLLEKNQLLSEGQELFYTQPKECSYFGQLMVSQTSWRKVKIRQRVLVRFEAYPSDVFGYITGEITHISNVSTENDSFLIKVEFPNGLQTNYNKEIPFRNNLSAKADVITENQKLLDRFLDQFRNITKH